MAAPLAGSIILGGLAWAGYDVSKTLKNFPPVSDAPEFGSTVTLPRSDGTTKDYVIVTSSGMADSTAQLLERKLKERSVDWDVYQSQNPAITQNYAKMNAQKKQSTPVVVYLGVPKDTKDFQYTEPNNSTYTYPPGATGRARFEEDEFIPLHSNEMNRLDYQVVHKQPVTQQNDVGILGHYKRKWAAKKQ